MFPFRALALCVAVAALAPPSVSAASPASEVARPEKVIVPGGQSDGPAANDLPRKRRAVRPGMPGDCASIEAQYQAALAEIREFVKTSVTVPEAPSVGAACADRDATNDYVEKVTNAEAARLQTLLSIAKLTQLQNCPIQRDVAEVARDGAALLARLEKKRDLLISSNPPNEKHPPILSAVIAIEKTLILFGYPTSTEWAAVAQLWLRSDATYYLKKLKEQHDYTAVLSFYNVVRDLKLLGFDNPDLTETFRAMNDALVFRANLTIETIGSASPESEMFVEPTDITAEGDQVFWGGVDATPDNPVPILSTEGETMLFPMAHATGVAGGCTLVDKPHTAWVELTLALQPCDATPLKVSVAKFDVVGDFNCDGQVGGKAAATNILMTIAFAHQEVPAIRFDGVMFRAPAFRNGNVQPVDDVWAGSGAYGGVNARSRITLRITHEPH